MNSADVIFLAAKKFEKQAGLFEEPLDLYSVMNNWARRRYFEQVLGRLNTKERSKDSDLLMQLITKRGFSPANVIKSISTKFPLYKIINWKYIDTNDKDSIIDLLKRKGWKDFVSLSLIFEPRNNESFQGQFNTVTHKTKIVADTNVTNIEEFNNELTSISDAVSHELTHLAQSVMKDYKNLRNEAGSPSKKETGSKEYLNENTEFYPILKDWIKIFNRYKFSSREEQEEYFKKWISLKSNGVDFFEALKEKEPEKWRKAVKEMYKAINWLPVTIKP